MVWDQYAERLYTAEELAKLNTRRDALRAKKEAKRVAAVEAKAAADEAARVARADSIRSTPLFATLTKYAERSEFLADLLRRYRIADLSEKQIAAVEASVAKFAHADKLAETSQFLGNDGERVPVAGVVTFVRCIHQAYPGDWINGRPDQSRFLVKVETDAGCVVVWFTANPPKEGARVSGKATIKARETYKGINQTTVKNFRETKSK